LNLTPEQLQQKATEELKKQVTQQVPGFEALIGLIGLLGVALVIGRKD
jgi:PGF-CTERM protein